MNRNTTTTRFPLADTGFTNMCHLSRVCGYPVRTLQRWKISGIPLYSADKLAIRLGRHPANIWRNWYSY